MKRTNVLLAAIAVMLGVNVAFAQKKAAAQPKNAQRIQLAPGRIVLGGTIGRNPLYLLRNTKIQTELKLEEDQKTEVAEAVKELGKKRREEYGKLRNLPVQQRVQKNRALAKQFNKSASKKVKEILEPKQLTRLKQIQLQMQGIRALLTPVVQKKLEITDDQKTKFAEVQKATAVARQKAFQDLRANGRIDLKKLRETTQKLQQKQEKDMHAVLTKKQHEQFEKMKGKKFDLPRRGGLQLRGGGIRLQIQGFPGGKIQIRRVKPKNANPDKKEKKKEGDK